MNSQRPTPNSQLPTPNSQGVNGGPRALTVPFVTGVVAVILLLAIGLPYWGVSTLHARRLDRADLELSQLASRLSTVRHGRSGDVLLGPGDRPRSDDSRWNAAPTSPLAAEGVTVRPDPWGNAYVVLVGLDGRPTRVLSAGPDGLLETPPTPDSSASVGDDRSAPVPQGTLPR